MTDIIILADESGSMGPLRFDTIGGINTFIDEQKKVEDGGARITLYTFSSNHLAESRTDLRKKFSKRDINNVRMLTADDYHPSGGTPLLDSIGQVLEETRSLQGKVVLLIITDGQENSSRKYKKSVVKELIESRQSKGWQIVYIGANVNAFEEASHIGISTWTNYVPSSMGTRNMYSTISSTIGSTRSASIGNDTLESVTVPDWIPEDSTVKIP